MQKKENGDEAAGTQQLIEYLGELWQRPHELSAEAFQNIVQLASSLEDPYRTMALTAIADHLVSGMSLRFLEIMATFCRKAEQEGIDAEEVRETFEDVMQEGFPLMMQLEKRVSVQSVEKLVNLCNASLGLYRHSQLASAENAQWWLYNLPTMYSKHLERENLLKNP